MCEAWPSSYDHDTAASKPAQSRTVKLAGVPAGRRTAVLRVSGKPHVDTGSKAPTFATALETGLLLLPVAPESDPALGVAPTHPLSTGETETATASAFSKLGSYMCSAHY